MLYNRWIMQAVGHFFKYASRYLRNYPYHSASSILILGLGIGLTTVFYSFVQQIVFAPLPFDSPEQLVGIKTKNESKGIEQDTISVAEFRDYFNSAQSFSSLAAYRGDFKNYKPKNGKTEQWMGIQVSSQFFELFKVSPLWGRSFEQDDFNGSSGKVAILSYDKWNQEFGEDKELIGKSISLSGELYTIIGVMPDGFREPYFADAWFAFPDSSPEYFVRNSRYWNMLGRVKPDVSIEKANAELATIAQNLEESYPSINKGWTTKAVSLLEIKTGSIRNILILGLLASFLVLVTTSLNITNLILAKGEKRRTEFATRVALGCTNRHLYFHILSETLGLSVLAGLLGAGIWFAVTQRLPELLPLGFLPRSSELQDSYTPLVFVALISTSIGALAGLVPSLNLSRGNLFNHSRTSSSSKRSNCMRNALVSLQVANLTIICALSLILHHNFRALSETPLGLEPDNLVSVTLTPNPSIYMDFDELGNYYQALKESIDSLPEVQQSSLTMFPPLFGFNFKTEIELKGNTRSFDETLEANYSPITPEFFELLKIPLKSGRAFSVTDTKDTQRVVIVTEAFAREFFPGEDPIGKEIKVLPWVYEGFREIVGVVKDYKQTSLTEDFESHVFAPMQQGPWPMANLLVKPHYVGAEFENSLRTELDAFDPSMGYLIDPLQSYIDRQTAHLETITNVIIVFALLTAGLTAIGLFALVVVSTSEQRKEIAIHLALGATRKSMGIRYTLRGIRLSVIGITIGLLLIAILNGTASKFTSEMNEIPLPSYVYTALIVLGISFLSSVFPSFNGTFIDINKALKSN
ncbi:MAG: ABC transporter permease [Puniceicoccaceae bacterium]